MDDQYCIKQNSNPNFSKQQNKIIQQKSSSPVFFNNNKKSTNNNNNNKNKKIQNKSSTPIFLLKNKKNQQESMKQNLISKPEPKIPIKKQFLNNTKDKNDELNTNSSLKSEEKDNFTQKNNSNQSTEKVTNSENSKIQSSSNEKVENSENSKVQKESSDLYFIQASNLNKRFSKTQTFRVIYNGETFIVDPISLSAFSLKFSELIRPFISDYEEMKMMHLEICGNQFTNRNMNNFLRLCQKLPTDVDNSEMKEICEIAKMFKAETIYKTGIDFVHEYLDPNFNVLDDKYDESNGKTYLKLVEQNDFISCNSISEDEKIKISNENSANNNEIVDEKTSNNDESADKEEEESIIDDQKSILYMVRVENHTFKCPIFKFVSDNHIVYTAKQKLNNIFIGEGSEIHIRNKENHVARIVQNEIDQLNKIHIGDTNFPLKYVDSGMPHRFSIEVTFPKDDTNFTLSPKMPRYDLQTEQYFLDFNGNFQHKPILSSRNIVLQNEEGITNFIVRKMDINVYEIECSQTMDPLVAFTIGLSDIVGPFNNPYENVNIYD